MAYVRRVLKGPPTKKVVRNLREQDQLYSSFVERVQSTDTSQLNIEDSSPANVTMASPAKRPRVESTGNSFVNLSDISPVGKDVSISDEVDVMTAEDYFEKFKDFLAQSGLSISQKKKDIHRPSTPEPRIFDSTFDSVAARDLTEPLEDGQILDKPTRCSDEIERECNFAVDSTPDSVGPDVSKRLVDMVKNFLERNRKAENIETLISSLPRPGNMPFLQAPKLNRSIYLKVSSPAQKFDAKCRKLQEYINAASTALTSVLQILVNNEDLKPEISQAGIKVKDALKILAFSNRDLNDRRKDALRNTINPMYLSLLNYDKVPSNEWLLGDDVDNEMEECDKVIKQGEKLVKSTLPSNKPTQGQNQGFRRRGRGRQTDAQPQSTSVPSSRQDTDRRYGITYEVRRDNTQRPSENNENRNPRKRDYQGESQDFYKRPFRPYYPNRRRY